MLQLALPFHVTPSTLSLLENHKNSSKHTMISLSISEHLRIEQNFIKMILRIVFQTSRKDTTNIMY